MVKAWQELVQGVKGGGGCSPFRDGGLQPHHELMVGACWANVTEKVENLYTNLSLKLNEILT